MDYFDPRGQNPPQPGIMPGGLPFMGFPGANINMPPQGGMINPQAQPNSAAFLNPMQSQQSPAFEFLPSQQPFNPQFAPPPNPVSNEYSNFSEFQPPPNMGAERNPPSSFMSGPNSTSSMSGGNPNPPTFSFASNPPQTQEYEHGSQFGYSTRNQEMIKSANDNHSTSNISWEAPRNFERATPAPAPPASSGNRQESSSNNGSENKIQIFTGSVSQVQDTFGMINNDVFFQRTCVSGPMPQLGDRVVVEAEPVQGMPFKFNAKKVQKLDKQLELDDYILIPKKSETPKAAPPEPRSSYEMSSSFPRPVPAPGSSSAQSPQQQGPYSSQPPSQYYGNAPIRAPPPPIISNNGQQFANQQASSNYGSTNYSNGNAGKPALKSILKNRVVSSSPPRSMDTSGRPTENQGQNTMNTNNASSNSSSGLMIGRNPPPPPIISRIPDSANPFLKSASIRNNSGTNPAPSAQSDLFFRKRSPSPATKLTDQLTLDFLKQQNSRSSAAAEDELSRQLRSAIGRSRSRSRERRRSSRSPYRDSRRSPSPRRRSRSLSPVRRKRSRSSSPVRRRRSRSPRNRRSRSKSPVRRSRRSPSPRRRRSSRSSSRTRRRSRSKSPRSRRKSRSKSPSRKSKGSRKSRSRSPPRRGKSSLSPARKRLSPNTSDRSKIAQNPSSLSTQQAFSEPQTVSFNPLSHPQAPFTQRFGIVEKVVSSNLLPPPAVPNPNSIQRTMTPAASAFNSGPPIAPIRFPIRPQNQNSGNLLLNPVARGPTRIDLTPNHMKKMKKKKEEEQEPAYKLPTSSSNANTATSSSTYANTSGTNISGSPSIFGGGTRFPELVRNPLARPVPNLSAEEKIRAWEEERRQKAGQFSGPQFQQIREPVKPQPSQPKPKDGSESTSGKSRRGKRGKKKSQQQRLLEQQQQQQQGANQPTPAVRVQVSADFQQSIENKLTELRQQVKEVKSTSKADMMITRTVINTTAGGTSSNRPQGGLRSEYRDYLQAKKRGMEIAQQRENLRRNRFYDEEKRMVDAGETIGLKKLRDEEARFLRSKRETELRNIRCCEDYVRSTKDELFLSEFIDLYGPTNERMREEEELKSVRLEEKRVWEAQQKQKAEEERRQREEQSFRSRATERSQRGRDVVRRRLTPTKEEMEEQRLASMFPEYRLDSRRRFSISPTNSSRSNSSRRRSSGRRHRHDKSRSRSPRGRRRYQRSRSWSKDLPRSSSRGHYRHHRRSRSTSRHRPAHVRQAPPRGSRSISRSPDVEIVRELGRRSMTPTIVLSDSESDDEVALQEAMDAVRRKQEELEERERIIQAKLKATEAQLRRRGPPPHVNDSRPGPSGRFRSRSPEPGVFAISRGGGFDRRRYFH